LAGPTLLYWKTGSRLVRWRRTQQTPGDTFDKISTAELQARLKPLIRKTQPYAKKIAHRGN
jgi:hypothetical protein